jgi:uncharacterized membrane protein (UPF0127 family)
VTYRLGVLASRGVVLAAAVVASIVFGAGASGAPVATKANLRLDGVPIRPQLALTPSQREVGLMHRAKAPADGMLFVFPSDTTDGFWMKNTLVPLTIVFFDAAGVRVRRLSMTPCRDEPCRIYYPRRSYRFALELPASDIRPARLLGPRAALAGLLGRAR